MQAIANVRQAEAWSGWAGAHWAQNRARYDAAVAAVANILRGLRPGGRRAFIGPQGGTPDSEYARATTALRPLMREPSPASRGKGSLVDPASIREVLDAAGFTGIRI